MSRVCTASRAESCACTGQGKQGFAAQSCARCSQLSQKGAGWRCSSPPRCNGCTSRTSGANTQPIHKHFIHKNTAKFMRIH